MACGVITKRALGLLATQKGGVQKLGLSVRGNRPTFSQFPTWTFHCNNFHTSVTCRGTKKAYTRADPFPPLAADTLRIYSMRFCPYAQRARLVAAHKRLRYEEININLKNKPFWFVDKNPDGTVPVVQRGDHVVLESVICMEYLDNLSPDHRLLPQDPYRRAEVQMAMTHVDKVTGKFYKVMNSDGDGIKDAVISFQFVLDDLEESLTEPFLCGVQPTLADYFIWPFFERIPLLDVMKATDVMPTSRYPRLTSWVTSMKATPGVKGTYLPPEAHKTYMESSISGTPDYDLGLEDEESR